MWKSVFAGWSKIYNMTTGIVLFPTVSTEEGHAEGDTLLWIINHIVVMYCFTTLW